jgi:hypothetical protein
MPFGVNQFSAEIAKTGVARTSNFLVEIGAPGNLLNEVSRSMPLRIEQVSIPSRTLTTFTQNYYGPPREIPYRYTSAPVSLTILLSEDMREREFFMQWQDLFVGTRRVKQTNPTAIYDCGYFKECVGSVTIKQYGESPSSQGRSGGSSLLGDIKDVADAFGINSSAILNPFGVDVFGISGQENLNLKEIYAIELVEAYPITVNEVQMNWGDDSFAKLQVEMRYTYVTEKHPKSDIAGAVGKSFLRQGIEAFQKFSPIFSLVRSQGIGGAIRSTISSTGQNVVNSGNALRNILPF